MLIPLGFKAADVWLREIKMKSMKWNSNEIATTIVAKSLQRAVSTTASWIKQFLSTGRPCSKLTKCRTTAGRGEVDSVFTPLMLGTHTQS